MRNNWKKTDLTGEWKLYYQENHNYQKENMHPFTTDAICARENCLAARVPGNFELDLKAANLLDDPYFGQNVLQLQKLESTHMFYGRKFEYHKTAGAAPVLTFEGLDTVAEIFLNGERIGACENMLIAQTFALENLNEGENDVVVHITPACIAARGRKISAFNNALKYDYESLRLRKSASMFGWDIMPRIVSGGIYRPVYIEDRPAERLQQVYLMVNQVSVEDKTADITLFYEVNVTANDLSEYSIVLRGRCEDHVFEATDRLWYTAGNLLVPLKDAKIWKPKGHGEQPLYDVEVILTRNGEPVDSRKFSTGIRTVHLERTALTDIFFNGKFQFYVNGEKIFILGTNLVPIDAFHSRDRERLPQVIALLEESGCNAIRCWGGGVYEEDALYDFCDEKGILVWQDFMMACGTYPVDAAFCEVMREEAEFIVRRLRQHPSLLLWSGDNECDINASRQCPSSNKITREVIPVVVECEDPVRPYLPSSPFVDKEAEDAPKQYLPENHLWGARDYYKSDFYRNSLCHFASEIGYHGCPCTTSIEEFIPADNLWPWQENDDWMAHAASMELGNDGSFNYRIKLMADQVKELFADVPDNLDDFVIASQISQAEAMKFFIEMFRMGQPNRTGIIWWNLIDGWPQFSDAVVDYYFRKKLAFYYIKQAQQPVILSMREPENWILELVSVNDTASVADINYTVKDALNGTMVYQDRATVPRGIKHLANIPFSCGEKKIYLMEWEQNGQMGRSHYLAGNPPFSLSWYRIFLESIDQHEGGGIWKDW